MPLRWKWPAPTRCLPTAATRSHPNHGEVGARLARRHPSRTITTMRKSVLDPRVAYVLTTMMEAVVNNGTGYTVRARGFLGSGGGQDRHLARRLVCRLYEQSAVHRLGGQRRLHRPEAEWRLNRRAHLGRVHEAGRQAAAVRRYARNFPAPSGVVEVTLDKLTNRLATPTCPQDYTVAFIAGTEPKETCDRGFTDHRGFFTKILGLGTPPVAAPPPTTNGAVRLPQVATLRPMPRPDDRGSRLQPRRRRASSAGCSARATAAVTSSRITGRTPQKMGTILRPNRSIISAVGEFGDPAMARLQSSRMLLQESALRNLPARSFLPPGAG